MSNVSNGKKVTMESLKVTMEKKNWRSHIFGLKNLSLG